jgi:hypothetical protein
MKATEEMGLYGLVNGLGLRGPSEEKAKLIGTVRRAARRGDWDRVIRLAAAYGVGASVGAALRARVQK